MTRRETVCFIARRDFESRPGGDTVQWRMYDRAAREEWGWKPEFDLARTTKDMLEKLQVKIRSGR